MGILEVVRAHFRGLVGRRPSCEGIVWGWLGDHLKGLGGYFRGLTLMLYFIKEHDSDGVEEEGRRRKERREQIKSIMRRRRRLSLVPPPLGPCAGSYRR